MPLGLCRDGFEFGELGRSLLVHSFKMTGGLDSGVSDSFSLVVDDFEFLGGALGLFASIIHFLSANTIYNPIDSNIHQSKQHDSYIQPD